MFYENVDVYICINFLYIMVIVIMSKNLIVILIVSFLIKFLFFCKIFNFLGLKYIRVIFFWEYGV